MNTEWQVYFFAVFHTMLKKLTDEVEALYIKNPDNYKTHKKTKLLAKVRHVLFQDIAIDPQAPHFNLGNYLGKENRSWKRAKDRMPARYRLFFKYSSNQNKIIIAWMNDEFTLRKQGAQNDVYNIFISMLRTGQIPTNWDELSRQSKPGTEK